MKKQLLIASAIGLAMFSSCQQEAGAPSQETIDSLVNERIEEIKAEWAMQNDSIINAEATRKADSIIALMKSGKAVTTKTTTTKTTTVKDPEDTKTNDGRLNTNPKNNDGRLDVKKSTDGKENDGRLKVK